MKPLPQHPEEINRRVAFLEMASRHRAVPIQRYTVDENLRVEVKRHG